MKTLPPAMIVDLDGTIADPRHRQHHIEAKDWAACDAGIADDEIRDTVAAAVYLFWKHGGLTPIFMTARGESSRVATARWLMKQLPWAKGFLLLMRPPGDSRPDYQVKHDIYESMIEPFFDVRLAFDDRISCVAMFRALGIECWHVSDGY